MRDVCVDTAQAVTRQGLSPEEQDAVVSVWLAWAAFEHTHADDDQAAWKRLLAASVRAVGVPSLHPRLLAGYFETELARGADAGTTLDKIVRGYHPTPAFFEPAFDVLVVAREVDEEEAPKPKPKSKGMKQPEDAVAAFYRAWKGACRSDSDRVSAALTYAHWLLEEGRGRDAHVVVETAKREVENSAELDEGWTQLLDAAEKARMGEDSDDEDEEMLSEGEGALGSEGENEEESGDEDHDEEMEDSASEGSGDLEMTL